MAAVSRPKVIDLTLVKVEGHLPFLRTLNNLVKVFWGDFAMGRVDLFTYSCVISKFRQGGL